MTIGILADSLYTDHPSSYLNKLIISNLQKQNPEIPLVFIFRQSKKKTDWNTGNIAKAYRKQPLVRFPTTAKAQEKALKKLVSDHRVDALLVLDVKDISSISIPQYLILHGMEGFEASKLKPLKQVSGILATSKLLITQLIKTGYLAEKLFLEERLASSAFENCSYDTKLAVREKYTSSKQYFVSTGFDISPADLVFLLKAYSLFKQRLQSSWYLVIVARTSKNKSELDQLVASYKYRADVVVLFEPDEETLAALTAAAYCFLNVSSAGVFQVSVLEALQCGVPAICVPTSGIHFFETAVVVTEEKTPEVFAESMMELYKDEVGHHQLAERGSEFLKKTEVREDIPAFFQAVLSGQS